jgi:hypothetical protein
MNYTLITILAILIVVTFVGCTQTRTKENSQEQNKATARQVKITGLPNLLSQLQNKQLQYDFFGITSNGVDCIYFVPAINHFDLEFEVMTEEQKPYLNKLRLYAEGHHWKTKDTTYGNTPKYQSTSPAPVLHMYTNASKNDIGVIGKQLMTDIFYNSESTTYDVVP